MSLNARDPARAPNAETESRNNTIRYNDQTYTEAQSKRQTVFSTDLDFARESDRRFFARFPERRHCVRPASLGEVAKLHRLGQPLLPEGAARFAIIKKTRTNCCTRTWFVAGAEMIFCEADEDESREVWQDIGDTIEVRL